MTCFYYSLTNMNIYIFIDICSLPAVKGTCGQQVDMYRYDLESSQCVRFTYSGCGGNANRFETRAMCEIACHRYMAKPEQRDTTPTFVGEFNCLVHQTSVFT